MMRSFASFVHLVSPKAVAIILSTLVGLGLIAEAAHYYWSQNEPLKEIDQRLMHEAGGLQAILRVARQQGLSSGAIKSSLDHYCSLNKTESYIEIIENDSVLFRSSNLSPEISFRTVHGRPQAWDLMTLEQSPHPVRLFSSIEEPYQFFVARSLSETESSWTKTHPALDYVFLAVLILLAPGGLIIAFYWHRPIQTLKKHVEDLSLRSKLLPLPPIPEFADSDISELVARIHKIIQDLHDSTSRALTFSSMASHEMRTPLSIIRHQLETALSSAVDDPAAQKVIATTYDEILRLSRTVEDLLSLTKLQAGTENLYFTYFGLHDFLKVFYDEALFLTRPKDITVVLSKVPPITIEADAGRLRQVLFNLLDNSIKNTPPQGRIRIAAEDQKDDVLITFSDTGRGIAPQNLSQIFEPFYSEAPNETDGRGTGLGLTLVKWIIESHRGNISVQSELNKGTEFVIRIPKFQTTPARRESDHANTGSSV